MVERRSNRCIWASTFGQYLMIFMTGIARVTSGKIDVYVARRWCMIVKWKA